MHNKHTGRDRSARPVYPTAVAGRPRRQRLRKKHRPATASYQLQIWQKIRFPFFLTVACIAAVIGLALWFEWAVYRVTA